jgi:hypothetical protein
MLHRATPCSSSVVWTHHLSTHDSGRTRRASLHPVVVVAAHARALVFWETDGLVVVGLVELQALNGPRKAPL